jgi:hypothetical protein
MRLDFDAFDLTPAEVGARFRWATRQGQAAWLWPGTPVATWRRALHDIEALARAVLSGRTVDAMLDGDPAAVSLACYTSGLGPLLGYWHEQARFPAAPEVAAVLELHLRHNRIRSTRMESAIVPIIEAFAERGIRVAVLKGAHTGTAYFGADGVRPASDIDLLVPTGPMAEAEAVIVEAGFSEASRTRWESSWQPATGPRKPRSLQLAHADDPWAIDLHGSLNISAGAGTPLARLDDAEPLASHSRWQVCPSARVLEQPLLLLHLAVHAGAGQQNLTLLRLTELALVARKDVAADALSWDAFLALGRRTGALGYAFPALKLCADLAPGFVPDWVVERCADHAPVAVRRLVERLTPSTAQRIDRNSMAEHAMWVEGWGGRLRQLASDLVPSTSWRELGTIYQRRAWTLMRGKIRP